MTKCPEFSVVNDEIDLEEDRDMMSVYPFEELEPYILPENLEINSDDEENEDHPIMPFSAYQKKMECVTDDGKVKKLVRFFFTFVRLRICIKITYTFRCFSWKGAAVDQL